MDTCLRLSTIDEVVSRRCKLRNCMTIAKQVNKINYFRFVCKEIALNELYLLFCAHYFSRLFPCYYYRLFFNDKRQTCLRDGKTLKVVLCTKFCPACDKQVIASALVQLRINFTCIFKVFHIALVASRLGKFCENFENTRGINP